MTVVLRPNSGGGASGNMSVSKYMRRIDRNLALFTFLVRGLHAKRSAPAEEQENGDEGADVSGEEDAAAAALGASTAPSEEYKACPTDHVVVLHGFSFKPAGRRNTHEKREEYCLAALILFTPFSCLDRATFLGEHATFQDAFAAAQNEGRICPEGVAYLRNVEIMWQHKDAAQTHR